MTRFVCLALVLALPLAASAQRRLVHDTLTMDSPAGIVCGFCATERFGVVFRELESPRRGLEPGDFPIVLESIEVVIAAAYGNPCMASGTGGTIIAPIEIYAGTMLPSGDISTNSEFEWPGETLVWAADAPIELSAGNAGGMYEFQFNVLMVRDEMDMPITIASGNYVRVVVTVPEGTMGTSPQCEPTYQAPAGAAVRDNDGLIAGERNFVFAAGGLGWFWNEAPPSPIPRIDGDWGVRLSYFAMGTGEVDAGMTTIDAGGVDAGRFDAGAELDAGRPDAGMLEPGGGCACRPTARATLPGALLVLVLALALLAQQRRDQR